jgi:hypothetical protein
MTLLVVILEIPENASQDYVILYFRCMTLIAVSDEKKKN